MKHVALVSAMLFLIGCTEAADQVGGTVGRAWPAVRFAMLTDPAVGSLAIDTDTRKSLVGDTLHKYGPLLRFGLGYDLKAVVPFKYHPEGIIRGGVDFGLNWLASGEGKSDPLLGITEHSRYAGSLGLILGELEIGRDSSAWRLRNINVGLRLKQAIPYTLEIASLIPLHDRAVGVTPLVVSLAGKQVFDSQIVDSSDIRLDVSAHWQIPIHYGLYFYPQLEANWQNEVRPRAFFNGEILVVLSESVFKQMQSFLEPLIFARYVEGRQSPNFALLRGWEYGAGTSITLGSARPKR